MTVCDGIFRSRILWNSWWKSMFTGCVEYCDDKSLVSCCGMRIVRTIMFFIRCDDSIFFDWKELPVAKAISRNQRGPTWFDISTFFYHKPSVSSNSDLIRQGCIKMKTVDWNRPHHCKFSEKKTSCYPEKRRRGRFLGRRGGTKMWRWNADSTSCTRTRCIHSYSYVAKALRYATLHYKAITCKVC